MFDQALALSQKLIQQPSVSPYDRGCQQHILSILKQHQFQVYSQETQDTTNSVAVFGTDRGKTLALAGHTDVVPPGELSLWHHPPFAGKIMAEHLLGRGAIDMKTALACMVIAATTYCQTHNNLNGRLVFLITSDEEADGTYGMQHLLQNFQQEIGHIDACLIGEPTSENILGDQYKIGRRGSINASIKLIGHQGHIAYPELATNPITLAGKWLKAAKDLSFDPKDPKPFPQTNLEFSAIKSESIACNVIPDSVVVTFNIRYTPQLHPDQLQQQLSELTQSLNIEFEWLKWQPTAGGPYLSKPGDLSMCLDTAISSALQVNPKLSVDGGTSDGRFISKICQEVIEFGPVRTLAHQINEQIPLKHIKQLTEIYYATIKNYFEI